MGDAYLRLWPAAEWPEHHALLDVISEWADIVLIGSDGSNALCGLNRRSHDYIRVERIGELEPRPIGRSLLEFMRAVAGGGP